MKKIITVPFFIPFWKLEKTIKKIFGEQYEIVDIFQDENRRWQVVVEKRHSGNFAQAFERGDVYRKLIAPLTELNIREVIRNIQKN